MVDELPGLRPRQSVERILAVLTHAAGLLGVTVAGWLVSAAISLVLLVVAAERRSPYLVFHTAQAALFQLVVGLVQVLYLGWLAAGFLSYGGELPGLADYRFFDTLPEPWLTIVQLLWGLSVLLWPFFHLATAALAVAGTWRTSRDRRFVYPLVGSRVGRRLFGRRRPGQRSSQSASAGPADDEGAADDGPADDGGLPGAAAGSAGRERPE